MTAQTHSFQAEVQEILNLMIHSLYSHREIFLRELISNASDACDKRQFLALTNPEVAGEGGLKIQISIDPKARILEIRDSGIGMTQEEVLQNIGTIGFSGTKKFIEMKKEIDNKPELIGQFGVGFYSAFMVASEVELHTQKAGTEEAILWRSKADGKFSIESKKREEGAGTTVRLFLKPVEEEETDFADENEIKHLVKKYSDYISYPITLKDEVLNSQQAIWLRPAKEVKDEEFKEFYHHLASDWSDPLKWISYKAEGTVEFSSLLYIPKTKSFGYDSRDLQFGLSLYVKKVLIMKDCKEILEPYLRFMKGVVDCSDISLNVSREMIQKEPQIQKIKRALTTKILNSLNDLRKNQREDYEEFFTSFGTTLKEAIPQDTAQRDRVTELLLFRSTQGEGWTTLQEYVDRKKPDQKKIYFLFGPHLEQLRSSSYLEGLKAKGYEVLLSNDPMDDIVFNVLNKFQDLPFVSVSSESLDEDTVLETASPKAAELKPFLESMAKLLKGDVEDVRISKRLTDSPACLVTTHKSLSPHMVKVLKAMGQQVPEATRVLEINPEHPIFEKMQKLPEDLQKEWADILYEQALLNEGSNLKDPKGFNQRITRLMLRSSLL